MASILRANSPCKANLHVRAHSGFMGHNALRTLLAPWCPTALYSYPLLSCETFRREPATRQFDWSFAPTPSSYDRFARQARVAPPPAFPQASHWPGIVHCLSGPTCATLGSPCSPRSLLGPCYKTGATCCLPLLRFRATPLQHLAFPHGTCSLSVRICI